MSDDMSRKDTIDYIFRLAEDELSKLEESKSKKIATRMLYLAKGNSKFLNQTFLRNKKRDTDKRIAEINELNEKLRGH
ncbi:MAG: hypothetical protein QXL94_00810 [Candidatus Parvarchaeum sp.]